VIQPQAATPMTKREVFNYPPTVEVLKLLTPGSLKQNLAKGIRLWVILRSIYGDDTDEVKLELGEEFTFLQWRDLFFVDAKKQHLRDKSPTLHDEDCHCCTKLTDDINIPKSFLDKCHGNYPPTPDDIKEKMSLVWGFDIYKPQELLLLRFDQYFYGNYIQGTERDEMFKKISRQQVEKFVRAYTATASPEQKKLLLAVQSRSENDVYCKVDYRVNDNNIVMRLRAWGPNVEVILPAVFSLWYWFLNNVTVNVFASWFCFW
jgi:hypothetical protein